MKAEKIKTYIVQWLLKGGLDFNKKRDAIGLEVKFSRKRRLADVLIVSRNFHALEIKGEHDNLTKLSAQINDYQKTFEMVSVIIALKHLNEVRKIIPSEVGIILFEKGVLNVIRKAKIRKRLEKASLLMFFNKQELIKILKIKKTGNYSTDEIRLIAKKRLSTKNIHNEVYKKLHLKYKKLLTLLQQDIGSDVLTDDLQTLYGKIEKIN